MPHLPAAVRRPRPNQVLQPARPCRTATAPSLSEESGASGAHQVLRSGAARGRSHSVRSGGRARRRASVRSIDRLFVCLFVWLRRSGLPALFVGPAPSVRAGVRAAAPSPARRLDPSARADGDGRDGRRLGGGGVLEYSRRVGERAGGREGTRVLTRRCGHYFCEKCALARSAKTSKCAACGAATGVRQPRPSASP